MATDDAEPDPQTCLGCYRDFPGDDPMITVGDDGDFCSYECIAQWLAEGSREHCWTHADLVDVYQKMAATMAAIFIFAKREGG